jgi:hypothetical protein
MLASSGTNVTSGLSLVSTASNISVDSRTLSDANGIKTHVLLASESNIRAELTAEKSSGSVNRRYKKLIS